MDGKKKATTTRLLQSVHCQMCVPLSRFSLIASGMELLHPIAKRWRKRTLLGWKDCNQRDLLERGEEANGSLECLASNVGFVIIESPLSCSEVAICVYWATVLSMRWRSSFGERRNMERDCSRSLCTRRNVDTRSRPAELHYFVDAMIARGSVRTLLPAPYSDSTSWALRGSICLQHFFI